MQNPNLRYLMVVIAAIACCLLLFLLADANKLVANGHLENHHLVEIDYLLDAMRFVAMSIGVAFAMHSIASLLGVESKVRWVIAIVIPSILLLVVGIAFGLDWLCNVPIESDTHMLAIVATFPFRFAIGFGVASVALNLLHRLIPLGLVPVETGEDISHPPIVG